MRILLAKDIARFSHENKYNAVLHHCATIGENNE